MRRAREHQKLVTNRRSLYPELRINALFSNIDPHILSDYRDALVQLVSPLFNPASAPIR